MKIWPARTKAKEVDEPVADLDALTSQPVHFRWKGKIHELKPMRLDEFLKFTNAQAKLLSNLKNDSEALTPKKLAEQYHAVIGSVCDSITVEDIFEMEQAQVAALYQLVIDLVTGQVVTTDSAQKKRLKIPLFESVQVSSSPNVVSDSVGRLTKH